MMANDDVASPWTTDDLLGGDPLTHGHGPLQMVWTQLHAHLHDDDERVVAAFCDAVRRRPGVISAKLVALHLVGSAAGKLAELVDELLVSDRLLYAHYRGTELVTDAIRARWTKLDESSRVAVIANIKYCEAASPSYARTRSLISAIPETDRDAALQQLLVDLGGPPPSPQGIRDLDLNEILERHGVEDPPARSIAERIVEIPTLLATTPIPWGRIASTVYDEEQSNEASGHGSARLLSDQVAASCADAALTAIESFPNSSMADHEREEVLRAADICLAHPHVANDDIANARLITALRRGVFHPPIRPEVAVFSLSFTRLWHWRLPRGRELVLDILSSAAVPSVVRAAIHPLYRAGADAIIVGARSLTSTTRADADAETSESLGQLMGNAALVLPKVSEEFERWLIDLPMTGVMQTAAARKEFLSGVAFSMKEAAHRHELDPEIYAMWATRIWKVWRTPELDEIEGRGTVALYLMSPLQERSGSQSVAAKYWPALRALFKEIVRSGDSNEVYTALFDLDIENLSPIAATEVSSILQDAARSRDAVDKGMNSEGRIAQVLCEIATHKECSREAASGVHQTLVAVGARKEALEVERRWRDRGSLS